MSKESFKLFVKRHSGLTKYVNNGTMTWQKFYELYDMYGEDMNVWSSYLETENVTETNNATLLGDTSLKEIFNVVKKIDLETVRRGVDGLQKAVNLIQDLSSHKNNSQPSYQRRPMYKYFED